MQNAITKIEIEESLLDRAKKNDRAALEIIFQQFIGVDETIQFTEYLGQLGILIFVNHSFICLTDKRVMALRTGTFGEVLYQDAFLEDLNSFAIYQPSLFGLYVWSFFIIVFTFGIGILFIPLVVKWYYRMNKCGTLFNIKHGLSVYAFINRNKMSRANVMWRICAQLREGRVAVSAIHA